MLAGKSTSFALSGLGAGFADRQRDLFAQLDAAENEHKSKKSDVRSSDGSLLEESTSNDPDMEVDIPSRVRNSKRPMKGFRGKESIFKRPEMPPPRRARHSSIADHQRNPHRWTRYSLADVSPQDMSERSNTVAAMAFLRELQARKDRANEPNQEESLCKPMFFKSTRHRVEQHTSSTGSVTIVSSSGTSEEADRPSFHSSKVVMPEYVVGQKRNVKKKRTSACGDQCDSNRQAIVLGHLHDEESE